MDKKQIKNKTITIRITESSLIQLKLIANKENRTISNLLQLLIDNYIEKEKKKK